MWKCENPAAYEHHLHPGEKQCAYCKAKADCPALTRFVADRAFGSLENMQAAVATPEEVKAAPPRPIPINIDLLAGYYLILPLVRDWCDAIEDKVKTLTLAGEIGEAQGLKVVAGKRGARMWDDPEQVEALLKTMRLKQDEMYTFKLISPTQAEKVLAESPRKWKKLADHIKQSEGARSVVHVSDPRPAINTQATADGFTDSVNDLL